MTTNFIPGLTLSGLFYNEIIHPILDLGFPGMPHSAALIGAGSEVLGFDTEMSSDHDWGPRIKLFLDENDFAENARAIEVLLKSSLPNEFRNYPAQWTIDGPSGNTCVELLTIRRFFLDYLGFDFYGRPFLVVDGGRFANALREKISDPVVKRIADRWRIGSVDQFSDSTDLLTEARSFRSLYE